MPKNATVKRLEALAQVNSSKRYLEIGVNKGSTLFNLTIDFKTGVDPNFRFDPAEYQSDTLRLVSTTSDEFFTRVVSETDTYDLILLDGLHVFEQTLRDFNATLAHSHRDTIWLIDDIRPSDVYSSLRTQSDANRFREIDKAQGKGWHGDTYKLVYMLEYYYPTFSFRTILAEPNPQLVAIRRRRENKFKQQLSVEAICRMTYFDMLDDFDAFHGGTEEEVMDWLKSVF